MLNAFLYNSNTFSSIIKEKCLTNVFRTLLTALSTLAFALFTCCYARNVYIFFVPNDFSSRQSNIVLCHEKFLE